METAIIGVAAFLWIACIVILLRLFKYTPEDKE